MNALQNKVNIMVRSWSQDADDLIAGILKIKHFSGIALLDIQNPEVLGIGKDVALSFQGVDILRADGRTGDNKRLALAVQDQFHPVAGLQVVGLGKRLSPESLPRPGPEKNRCPEPGTTR